MFTKFREPVEPKETEESRDSAIMKNAKVYILVFILAVLLLCLMLPKRCPISIQTTAYEYAMDQKEPIAEHTVIIEGRYTRRLFREDVFQGQLTVSGFSETEGASAYIQFPNDYNFGMISYQQDGIPVWNSELKHIYTNLDFSVFVIQLFEVSQDEDGVSASWNPEDGRVLTTGPDYASMQELCDGFHMSAP